ncbi:MAG TPA: RT0821/Lpp0805 family surface protein [Burkholderiales bacterium]|nr:RT0821/Lpp0805 family surface protein [Burkholderiales bacterium]
MKRILRIALCAFVLPCTGGFAFNLLHFADTPLQYMTSEDKRIFYEAAATALDSSADGQATSWENPATGARGELLPRASFERDGRACRELQIENSARGRNNRLVLTVCKQQDGDWKVEPQ